MSSYRHDPFKAAKRRRRKKSSLNSPAKRNVKGLSSKKENLIELTNTISVSHRKTTYDPSSSSNISSDEEERFDAPKYWIVDINNIVNALQKVCVCIKCHNNLGLVELVNVRAGFGTKFSLRCLNPNCDIEESFHSTYKTNRVYEVNKKSVLESRVIGKGRIGLLKLCSVLGLSSPVTKSRFTEHFKNFEEKAFILRDENFKRSCITSTRFDNLRTKLS